MKSFLREGLGEFSGEKAIFEKLKQLNFMAIKTEIKTFNREYEGEDVLAGTEILYAESFLVFLNKQEEDFVICIQNLQKCLILTGKSNTPEDILRMFKTP